MTYNLLKEDWIPLRRKGGRVEVVRPAMFTDAGPDGDDPFVAPAAPRPDFNGALMQFFIGLAQTEFAPGNDREWRNAFTNPPSPEEIDLALAKDADAFNLDGPGPRFMQDLDELADGKQLTANALLIEEPGGNTLKENKDHFIKRGRVQTCCLPCAATTLLTLQLNAPAGGAGHRTSLRGGGPLVTLVLGETLWQTVWLNVLLRDDFLNLAPSRPDQKAARFAWMGPTKISNKGHVSMPEDFHADHVYWSMPRRIRMEFEESGEPRVCDLCGAVAARTASGYRTRPHGFNYEGPWLHPLTPYFRGEGPPSPVHGRQGGVCYRDWLGLAQRDPDDIRLPALTVREFLSTRQKWARLHPTLARAPRIWAFGYDMDNMKARGWSEGFMPLVLVDEKCRALFERVVSGMVASAQEIAGSLVKAVKTAWPDNKTPQDSKPRLWEATETGFYQRLGELAAGLESGWTPESPSLVELKTNWLRYLAREAEKIFEILSQADLIGSADPKRIARGRNDLIRFSSPKNKKMKELLNLP